MLDRFIQHIQQKNLFTKKDRLLLAVSGGIDSVVLGKLCELAGFNFGIAHCNFQLRDEESLRDEYFVKEFAAGLGAPFYVVKFETKTFAHQNNCSTQEAARMLRYQWFEKIRSENGYDYILTAHHADDNIETMLMNFFRGTGIKGLTGIREQHEKLRRPLLFAKRKELEVFLEDHGLKFVQDRTNLTDDYTRNYFRNTLLPLIAKVYPEVQENLLHNIERFKEVEILYKNEIERSKKKLLKAAGDEAFIPILLLQNTPAMPTVLLELLKPYHFKAAQLPEVVSLLQSESGKYLLSPTHRILKDRRHLIISPLKQVPDSAVVIEDAGSFRFTNGTLRIKYTNDTGIPKMEDIACADASKIQFPLLLRPWRTGDYFYPLGMDKKKKLSRFFIDRKLSLADKEKVWVLEMNKKIIWVIGFRMDERFKITGATQSVLRIEYHN